jgi:hypothetical protein
MLKWPIGEGVNIFRKKRGQGRTTGGCWVDSNKGATGFELSKPLKLNDFF